MATVSHSTQEQIKLVIVYRFFAPTSLDPIMVSVKVIKYHVNASFILYRSRKLQQTTQTCCKLWILPACRKMSSSCSESVGFIKLQQVCENQTCCNLIFADLLQVVETTSIKLVDKKC